MSNREQLHAIIETLPEHKIAALIAVLAPTAFEVLERRLQSAPEVEIDAAERAELEAALAQAEGDPGLTLADIEREELV